MYRVIKSVLDIFIAILLLVLSFPMFLIIAIFIKIDSRGHIFFLQDRIGKRKRIFRIIKFRTMYAETESSGNGIFTHQADPRITHFGKFLRKYSLDEIPQLINIIKGDMSFVGPRPPVPFFPYNVNEYPKIYLQRFDVKPGVTGLAQISGRTNLKWEERFLFDNEYVEKYCFVLDLIILMKTVLIVIKKENIYPTDLFRTTNHKMNAQLKNNDN